jgi:hypothetical protein
MRVLIGSALALTFTIAAAAPDPKKPETAATVRPIDVAIPGPAKGKATEPTVIANAEELAKAVADDEAATAIKKAVDFKTEKLLLFTWAGSGQDKITFAVEDGKKGPEVTFTYTRGFTRDLRQHKKLFALPKDATFKVIAGK